MREQYKVLVNSKAEAKMYRKALLAIGEKVSINFSSNSPSSKWPKELDYREHSNGWILGYPEDKQEITFKELIKLLVNEEVKKPLITTVDGVYLFGGDSYHRVYLSRGKWEFNGLFKNLEKDDFIITDPNKFKAFHSKQAALDWCREQNKAKEIEVKLPPNHYCKVDSRDVMFFRNGEATAFFRISFKELKQIDNTIKQLTHDHR